MLIENTGSKLATISYQVLGCLAGVTRRRAWSKITRLPDTLRKLVSAMVATRQRAVRVG
jgi:hypothetical protein